MIPHDPDELHALAGEYVLGTLDAPAASEVEAALATNPLLRRAVIFWEERLHGLSGLAAPADPPPGTWQRIAARLAFSAEPRPRLWNSLPLWRWSTAGATALAASLALYIALALPTAPRFVAILHAPQQQQPAWLATAGDRGLLLRALATEAAPPNRSFELWAIAPGAPPLSLGVIPAAGRLELAPRAAAAMRNGDQLAITIEPEGGSPTGQPTGPVVFAGTLIAAR
jgi:anti-sigma-K factor RskA